MKVKLLCVFGDKTPDTVVELKKEVAEQLIKDGNAIDTKELVAKDSKEVIALKKELEALQKDNDALKKELEALQKDKG